LTGADEWAELGDCLAGEEDERAGTELLCDPDVEGRVTVEDEPPGPTAPLDDVSEAAAGEPSPPPIDLTVSTMSTISTTTEPIRVRRRRQ
jgi:hypothetical protein